ncbi:MAG: hypothetical protein QW589_00665 [Candidatus Bathyarchaeia archaeon]
MRKKIKRLCLVTAFILILNLALIEFDNNFRILHEVNAQARPRIKVEALNETLSSNTINNVIIVVKNDGKGVAKSITLQVIPLNTYLIVIGSNIYAVESLGEDESKEIAIKVYVSKGVSGSTGLRVSVVFRDEFWNFQEVVYTLGFNIVGKIEFALQKNWQEPSKIFPGDLNVILTAIIVNTGSIEAKHLNATLNLHEGIKPSWAKSNNVYVGSAFPDTPIECKFYLDIDEFIPHGLYNLELELIYDNGSFSLFLPLFISEKANFEIIDLSISQKEIHPGDRGVRIQATIKNSGNVKAKEVVVKLVGSYFSGMTTSFLGVLNQNDKSKAIFEVDISREAPIGENLLQFQISWIQEGRSLTQNIFYKIEIFSSNVYFYVFLLLLVLIVIFLAIYFMIKKENWKKVKVYGKRINNYGSWSWRSSNARAY